MRHSLLVTMLLSVTALLSPSAWAQQVREKPAVRQERSFAIIVDSKTYEATTAALRKYKSAVEADGLAAWIIADDWKRPEAVRAVIQELVKAKPPLEGAVFVGRIPVPMIRDAQHMTSAFKMDQERYPRRRSSIPSDRFYEDLDLRFDPLGSDEKEPLLHYYSLRADSPQVVDKEIYSGRMLFGEAPDPERLRSYLDKVVRRKRERRPLQDALVVTGHGYNSGSVNAWAGQAMLLREQMPWLYQPGGRVRQFFHAEHRNLKTLALHAVQQEGLDLAVFHAHGSFDKQYLLGLPPATTSTAQAEALQRDLRTRLRRAKKRNKDVEEAKKALMKRFDLPESWFAGAFDPEITRKDEQADHALDIHLEDLDDLSSQPEVVIFDECFNGRFIEKKYIAGAYVFGKGGTVAAIANSVNILQDVWADESVGLLGVGWRVGEYHRLRGHLESHIIGDPTFRYAQRSMPEALSGALRAMHREGQPDLSADRLEKDLLANPSDTIRLASLRTLARIRPDELARCLLAAVKDPNEMLRRQVVRLMGDQGDPAFIPVLLEAWAFDPSRRVAFQAQTALGRFEGEQIKPAILAMKAPADIVETLTKRFGGPNRFVTGDLAIASDGSADPKKRARALRSFRLYRVDAAVPALLTIARSDKNPAEVRKAALEALGWFVQSRRRKDIIAACQKIESDDDKLPPAVRLEAEKTRRRLTTGPNDPFTP